MTLGLETEAIEIGGGSDKMPAHARHPSRSRASRDASMSLIDLAALEAAPLAHEPFDHVIVPGFLAGEALDAVTSDFPNIDRGGSFPLSALEPGPVFDSLMSELRSPELTRAVESKFGIELAGRPVMQTVRGRVRPADGQIHTDSGGKLITMLLYLNQGWEADGGRLRLLRGPNDLDDYAAEVPPEAGTLLVFRCANNAWHGHAPVEGERRSVQINWVRDARYLWREQVRHGVSALFKKLRAA